jgi:hypothetical protein
MYLHDFLGVSLLQIDIDRCGRISKCDLEIQQLEMETIGGKLAMNLRNNCFIKKDD